MSRVDVFALRAFIVLVGVALAVAGVLALTGGLS